MKTNPSSLFLGITLGMVAEQVITYPQACRIGGSYPIFMSAALPACKQFYKCLK